MKDDKIEKKSNESEELKKRISELEDQVKRTLADYRNLEKRVLEERREWIITSNKGLLLRILPILDTLITASKHSEDQNLKISVAQFLDILKGEGVTKIKTVGNEFDPKLMEVVTTIEVDPSAGSGEGKVVEEIRTGYMLNDKVLRAAQVAVGKKRESI